MRAHRSAARRFALALVLALGVLAVRPSPVASGPRPPVAITAGLADPWQPPAPRADARFATLPYADPDGRTGTWVISDQRLPLRVVVEREVAERFGFDAVRDALSVWNEVPGSRFRLDVAGIADSGAERKRRDGVSRVFLDRVDCDDDDLARAHLHPGQSVERNGLLTNFLWEVDIGICDRMRPDRLAPVLRHEVGHVAGLGHICDPGDECWVPEMGQENRCRVMYPSAYRCQEPTVADDLGLIHLYPRLPRIPTGTPEVGPAAASLFAHRRPRSVGTAVLVTHATDPRLQVEAAQLAGLRGAPLLVVGEDCTSGTGADELNRVLTVHADVTLIGAVSDACATALRFGWELDVEQLEDHEAVVDAVLRELGNQPRAAIIVGAGASTLADAVVAVPVAMRRDAVLLRADETGLTAHAQGIVRDHPSIGEAIIIGSAFQTNRQAESDLVDLGVPYRRVDAGDRAATALAVWADRDVFGPRPHDVLLTSGRSDALLTTAALAASLRWPVLLTPADSLDGRVALALRAASGGLVVGSPQELSDEVQVRASRAVDRWIESGAAP